MEIESSAAQNAAMSDLGTILRQARKRRDLVLRDVAAALNVSVSAVGQWERNEDSPSTDNLRRVCAFLRIDPGCALMGVMKPAPGMDTYAEEHIDSQDIAASLDRDQLHSTVADLPFEDAVAQISGRMGGGSTGEVITIMAGDMQTVEPVAAWWRIPPNVIRSYTNASPNHIAGWLMDGDSMEPTISRSDIVFVDTHRRHIEPDGIWAVDYGLGRTLKRIEVKRHNGNERWTLMSDNPRYSPQDYAPEEVTIFGRYLFRFTMF